MEHVAKTLNMVREASLPAAEEIHSAFVDRRNRLNQHAERMHRMQAPTGLSIYQMQGLLLKLPVDVSSSVRWRAVELTTISTERARNVRDLLAEAAGFEALFNRTDPSPWCGLDLPNAQAAQGALDGAVRVAFSELPSLLESLTRLTQSHRFQMPTTMTAAIELLAGLAQSNDILSTYDASVFTAAENLAGSLASGRKPGLRSLAIRVFSPAYKRAYKQAVSLRTSGKAGAKQVLDELNGVAAVLQLWKKWSGTQALPIRVDEAAACQQLCLKAEASLRDIEGWCKLRWRELPIQDVLARVQAFADDASTPYRASRTCEIERDLQALGTQRLIDEIRSTRRPARQWIQLFDYIWLTSTLDMAALNDPGVRAFVGTTHNGYVDDFKKLDTKRLDVASARVRRAC